MSEKKEYIERGAAFAILREASKQINTELDKAKIAFAMTFLSQQPAADVEPVVRGECEHCSSKIQTANDGQPFSQEFYLTTNGCKFCPQCGRKLHMERSGSGE